MPGWRSHRQARQRHHKSIRSPVGAPVPEIPNPYQHADHTLPLDIPISTFQPRPVLEASLETAPSTSTAQTLHVLPAPTSSLSALLATTLPSDPTRLRRPLPQSHSSVVPALRLSALVQLLLVSSRSCCEPDYSRTKAGSLSC